MGRILFDVTELSRRGTRHSVWSFERVIVSKSTAAPNQLASVRRFFGSTPFSIALISVLVLATALAVWLPQHQSPQFYNANFAFLGAEQIQRFGLDQVFSSSWFLALVLLLLLSSCYAILRHYKPIVRELRDWRDQVKHQSLLHSRQHVQWRVAGDAETLLNSAARTLKQHGFQSRVYVDEQRALLSARAGHRSRLGLLLCHVGIACVCVALLGNGLYQGRSTSPELPPPSTQPISSRAYLDLQVRSLAGSETLSLEAWPLQGQPLSEQDVRLQQGRVVIVSKQGATQEPLDYSDFEPLADDQLGEQAPAVVFWLHRSGKEPIQYISYLQPVDLAGGLQAHRAGQRSSVDAKFQYLALPTDTRGTLDRFVTLLTKLTSHDRVTAYAREAVDAQGQLPQDDPRLQLAARMGELLDLYLQQGAAGLDADIRDKVPQAQQAPVRALTQRLLETVLLYAYQDVLLEEGVEVMTDFDRQWLRHAVQALAGIQRHGSPFFLQFQGSTPYAAQGSIVSYLAASVAAFGIGCLIAGLLMQFCLRPRRLWVSLLQGGEHELIFAGFEAGEKKPFAQEFASMADALKSALDSHQGK